MAPQCPLQLHSHYELEVTIVVKQNNSRFIDQL
jgi:hypothetical protein